MSVAPALSRFRGRERPSKPARAQPEPEEPARASARERIISGALVILLWCVVLVALTSVLAWGPWWVVSLGIIAVTIGVAGAARVRFPHRPVGAAACGVAAGVLLATVRMSAAGRIVPWWSDPAAMLQEAQLQIVGGSAPLTVDGALADLVLAVVLLMAAATAFLLHAADAPLAAGALSALVLLVPPAATGSSSGAAALIPAAALLALLAIVRAPRRSWQGVISALLAAALAVGVCALLPTSRDRLWNNSLLSAPVSQSVPDVTLALAEDLRARSGTPAFTYSSSVPGPIRFTLATLATFEGGVWRPEDAISAETLSERSARSPARIPPGAAAPAAERPDLLTLPPREVRVTIKGLLSAWLPLPQSTLRVDAIDDSSEFRAERWRWSERANTARSERDVTRRDTAYAATAVPLDIDQLPAGVLQGLPADATARISAGGAAGLTADDPLAPYLALPGAIPEDISRAAAEVAGGQPHRLSVGRALQSWFRSGAFSYSEAAPYDPGSDSGDPYAVMRTFLETRSGFCVHYAATFAVMARDLGVPTRISVGYASRAERDAETLVLGRQLHAWPEIYVDDLGWVSFEPTPGGAGADADGANDPAESPSNTGTPTEVPSPEPTNSPLTGSPTSPDQPPSTAETTPDRAASGPTAVIPLLAAAIAVLALLSAPALWRARRRTRHLARIARGDRPATAAWDEVRDTAQDLGWMRLTAGAESPRARTASAWIEEWARRGALDAEPLAAVRRIAQNMEQERYGPIPATRTAGALCTQHSDPGHDVRVVIRALRATAGRRSRIRATLLPRSLTRR